MSKSVKACGILPVAFKRGEIFFLAGRESDTRKYCGFGGMIDKYENYIQCALREGYEETLGIIGDKIKLFELLVENSITSIYVNNCYLEYIIQIDFDEEIPEKFQNKLQHAKKNRMLLSLGSCFFEKLDLKWFPLKNYKQYIDQFRECFVPVLEELVSHLDGKTF